MFNEMQKELNFLAEINGYLYQKNCLSCLRTSITWLNFYAQRYPEDFNAVSVFGQFSNQAVWAGNKIRRELDYYKRECFTCTSKPGQWPYGQFSSYLTMTQIGHWWKRGNYTPGNCMTFTIECKYCIKIYFLLLSLLH